MHLTFVGNRDSDSCLRRVPLARGFARQCLQSTGGSKLPPVTPERLNSARTVGSSFGALVRIDELGGMIIKQNDLAGAVGGAGFGSFTGGVDRGADDFHELRVVERSGAG